MTTKIRNEKLYDTNYIEEIIKENINGITITPADSFGHIMIQREEVLGEIHCKPSTQALSHTRR